MEESFQLREFLPDLTGRFQGMASCGFAGHPEFKSRT